MKTRKQKLCNNTKGTEGWCEKYSVQHGVTAGKQKGRKLSKTKLKRNLTVKEPTTPSRVCVFKDPHSDPLSCNRKALRARAAWGWLPKTAR